MGSVAGQLFSGLSRDVQVGALAGPLKDIQRLVAKSLVVLAVCLGLLSCWKVNLSLSLSALEQVSIKYLSVRFSVHLSLDPD